MLDQVIGEVLRHYPVQVYRVSRIPGGYLVETDKGWKKLERWDDQQWLDWSFRWREAVAGQGLRTIERFIRTEEGWPYVWLSCGGYTLTDHVGGRTPDPFQRTHGAQLGRLLGKMHQARVKPASNVDQPRLFKREPEDLTEDGPPLIAQNAPRIRERDRRALEWMEREKARLYEAGATHPVTRRNVVRVADTWYVQGSQMRRAVFKHDHLAAFLKNIYRDSGRRLDVVHAVLNGYGNERSLDTGDVRLLLAFMIDPLPLRRFMESKRGKNEWRPADRSHVEALFREQEMREKLAHHIAGWFDQ